jgi:hypothetical protein
MRALLLGILLVGLPAAAGGRGGGGFHGGIGHSGGGFSRGSAFGGRHLAAPSVRSAPFVNRGNAYFRPRWYGYGGVYPGYWYPYAYTPWYNGYYSDQTPYEVAPAPQAPVQEAPPPADLEPPGPTRPQMYGPPPGAPPPQQANIAPARPESMGSRADVLQDTGPGPDVYHWVDADGVDNYSTSVPPEARAHATKVGIRLSGVVWTNQSAASKSGASR